jgi:hypothetical protein
MVAGKGIHESRTVNLALLDSLVTTRARSVASIALAATLTTACTVRPSATEALLSFSEQSILVSLPLLLLLLDGVAGAACAPGARVSTECAVRFIKKMASPTCRCSYRRNWILCCST